MVENLLDFLYKSPSAYQAVENTKNILKNNNYTELFETEDFKVKKNGKYFVTKGDTALIAVEIGNSDLKNDGVRIIGAHTDSPCIRIKPESQMIVANHYIKLNVECYGGIILSTWFDRPLGICGKVVLKGKTIKAPIEKLININRPIVIIPTLAIHLNREVNDGYKYNRQLDMTPIAGLIKENLEKNDFITRAICGELKVTKEDILDFDLLLYDTHKGEVMGLENEFVSSSRLDDLWMGYAGLMALTKSENKSATKVLLLVDHEEVGSSSYTGAASSFMENTLERIYLSLGYTREEFLQGMANSFAISADLAHALHPNYTEKHDPTNRPLLGKGPVVKYSANQKYSTSAKLASIFKRVCIERNIPFQTFANRSDAISGSTIGPIMSKNLGIAFLDVGAPLLSMHSIREFTTVADVYSIEKSFIGFFELV